jgi:heterodisulfide reductase subunit A
MCPFGAISFLADRAVSEINPALCQGCGTCVVACPAGAITGSHYTNTQIMSQIEGILMVGLGQLAVPSAEAVPVVLNAA